MSFVGVSVISDGQLLGSYTDRPAINAGAASGYHLLVVERHSRTKIPSVGYVVTSNSFTIGGHRWRIFYYGGGNKKENAGFISVHLCLAEYKATPVKAQLEFSFVDETEKQEPARIHCSKVFEFRSYTLHGDDMFMSRDALAKSRHLNGDSFTIRCDVVVADEDVTTPFIEVPPSDMKQNFSDLLYAGHGTDVVFKVSGESFAAHRCVLAARSAVFKASLFGPMKESSASTVVQIDDMDATVFKAMLGFIYGDSLPAPADDDELEDGVLFQHLLVAADRYGLQRLKAMCEKKLCDHIGVSTTTTILALAEQHRCNGLKEACYEFLRCPANLKAVVDTDGFDDLCRSCPSVMKGLVVAVGMLQPPK
jgi:speckle-type POZ protein